MFDPLTGFVVQGHILSPVFLEIEQNEVFPFELIIFF